MQARHIAGQFEDQWLFEAIGDDTDIGRASFATEPWPQSRHVVHPSFPR
jgi:hypothetical protein